MAYIDKRTFDIYSSVLVSDQDDSVFECDDMIAPAIRILNLKGYTTESCCSGHPYPSRIDMVVHADSIDSVYDFIPGIYDAKEVTLGDLKGTVYYDSELQDANSSTKTIYKHTLLVKSIQSCSINSYISFEEGKKPKSLPKGWKCYESFPNDMIYEFKHKSKIGFFRKQVSVMKKLIKWAKSLPKYE